MFLLRAAAVVVSLTVFGPCSYAASITQLTSASQLSAQDTAFVDKDKAGTTYPGPSVTFNNGNNLLTFSRGSGQYETDVVGYNYGDSAFANGTVVVGAGGFQGSGDSGPVRLTFSLPVTQFGLNVEDFDLADNGTANLYKINFTAFDPMGALLGTYSANGCSNNSCLSFEGLSVSGDTIGSILFSDVSPGFNNLLFGNIAYGSPIAVVPPPPAATPEPSSLALLGTGMVGVVEMVRRRLKR